MPDDLLCAALARSIAVRLPLASHDELRVLDVVLQTLEAIRHGDGRDWLRHVATGPGDVDPSYHAARRLRATVATACGGSWPIDDAVELSPNPPLVERCHACWRGAAYSSPGGPALGEALLVVVAEMAERDHERKELREQARAEMLGGRVRDGVRSEHFAHCTFVPDPSQPQSGFCSRDGFTMESHCLQCYREHRRVRIAWTATSIMDADPATKARALDQMEQECRRLTIESEREFAADQHRTRLDSTSAVMELCEIPRARDGELEVEIWIDDDPAELADEWGVGEVGGEA